MKDKPPARCFICSKDMAKDSIYCDKKSCQQHPFNKRSEFNALELEEL